MNFNNISLIISYSIFLLLALIWLSFCIFLRRKKNKSFAYLLFFTIFYIYIVKVLDYTLFQFQSLLLLKHFIPTLLLNGISEGKNINLIPILTLTSADLKTSLLNILLFIPFGFGLPFITNFRLKKISVAGVLFSITIELLQLLSAVTSEITFRVSDINDVIFNTIGSIIGYVLFIVFLYIYRNIFSNSTTNPILKYISEKSDFNFK